MSKPIKFELEFSGYGNLRIDDSGATVRPPTAEQMAQALAEDLQRRCDEYETGGRVKMRVKLRRVA